MEVWGLLFLLVLMIEMVEMIKMVEMVWLTAREETEDVVKWTEDCPDMEEVNGGGTHGEEGNVHPGSDLQTELLRLGGVNDLGNPGATVVELVVIIIKVSRHSDLSPGYQHGDVVLRLVKEDGGVAPPAQVPVVDAGYGRAWLAGGS